MIHLS